MSFPIALADYIAKSCGLPSLYVGEYKGLEINYIWSITNEDAWNQPRYASILVSSNKWLRGLNFYWREKTSSKLVDLSEDFVLKILKQHNDFKWPEINDGYHLRGDIFHKYGYRTIFASNPAYSSKPSVEFDKAFNKVVETIHEKSEQNQDVIAPALTLTEPKGSFVQFLEFAYNFGLSGLFDQPSPPDNLEYILNLNIHASQNFDGYLFVKTSSWFRGTKFQYSYKGEDIVDLPEIEVDWRQLLQEAHDEGQRTINQIIYIKLYCKGEVISTQLKIPDESDTSSPLWNALRPLMEQLNQEK